MLWSTDFVEGLPEWRRNVRNPMVVALWRSDAPESVALRQQVLRWFSEEDEATQSAFRPRLESRRDDTFLGALAELGTAALLRRAGFSVKHDPSLQRRTPDLELCTADGGRYAIVEVGALIETEREKSIRIRREEITRRLRKVCPPNWLIAYHGAPDVSDVQPVAFRKLRERLLHSSSDSEEIEVCDGLVVRATRIEGVCSVQSTLTQRMNLTDRLKETARSKHAKYSDIVEAPLIVAIWDYTHQAHFEELLIDAMFGTSGVSFRVDADPDVDVEPQPYRDRDGIATKLHSDREYLTCRKLSALLVLQMVEKYPVEFRAWLLHNPFAQKPVEPAAFSHIRQLSVAAGESGALQIGWNHRSPVWHTCETT